MNLVKWFNLRIKRLNLWDIQLIKISSAAFILMIAKLWEPILSLNWYWYGIIMILFALKPLIKVYKK